MTLLPTPRTTDANRAGEHGVGGMDLRTAVASSWGIYEPAIRRQERVMGPAPDPTELGRTGRPRLAPVFVEWLMGLPAGWVTSPDIGLSRNAQLRRLGNGVVPAQVAAAIPALLARAGHPASEGLES